MASQQQFRASITNQIVAAQESGNVPPWRRPWRLGPDAGFPANVVSKKAYRGFNSILLDGSLALSVADESSLRFHRRSMTESIEAGAGVR
jgi:antirestriction protein ArdC